MHKLYVPVAIAVGTSIILYLFPPTSLVLGMIAGLLQLVFCENSPGWFVVFYIGELLLVSFAIIAILSLKSSENV